MKENHLIAALAHAVQSEGSHATLALQHCRQPLHLCREDRIAQPDTGQHSPHPWAQCALSSMCLLYVAASIIASSSEGSVSFTLIIHPSPKEDVLTCSPQLGVSQYLPYTTAVGKLLLGEGRRLHLAGVLHKALVGLNNFPAQG